MNQKESYDLEVAKTLFQRFMSQEKEERTSELKLVQNYSRPEKYLYYLNQLPFPILAYVWGILSYEDAQELVDAKQIMEQETIIGILDSLEADDYDEEQQNLLHQLRTEVDKGIFKDDITDSLAQLDVDPNTLAFCNISYEDFFKRLLTDKDYCEQDMYVDILRRLKPEYISFIWAFQQITHLFTDRKISYSQTDLIQEIESKNKIKSLREDDIFGQIDMVNSVLCECYLQHKKTPLIRKCDYLWNSYMQEVFNEFIISAKDLPEHKSFPSIHEKITQMSQSFQQFFAQKPRENLFQLRNTLFHQTREVLKSLAITDLEEKKLLDWFDTKTSLFYKEEENDSKQPIAPEIICSKLKEKYLLDEDYFLPNAERFMFALAKDYEMLYLMGILNKSEYDLCASYQNRPKDSKKDYTVSDIFGKQLDEDIPTLPLKKEYMTAMHRIQLASAIYRQAYLSSLEHKSIYSETDDILEKEGHFLNNFIAFSRYCDNGNAQKRMNCERQLTNMYWNTVTHALMDISPYPGRPAVKERVYKNINIFNTQEGLFEKNEWLDRLKIYQSFIKQFQQDIDNQYRENPQLHEQMNMLFNDIVQPFKEFVKERGQQSRKNRSIQRDSFNQKERTE